MFKWLKKIFGPVEVQEIPEVKPKDNLTSNPVIKEMVDDGAPFLEPKPIKKGRKKRSAQPPRR